MKIIIKLLFGLFFSVASLHGTLEAKQLNCDVIVMNLNVEALLQSGTSRSYDANVSCVFKYLHHDGGRRLQDYNDKLGPIVVKTLPPKGGIDAEGEAIKMVFREGDNRLKGECKTNNCNCLIQGCGCFACKRAPNAARNNQVVEAKKSLQTNQVDENIAGLKTPVVLKNIKNIKEIKAAQDKYLVEHYKNYFLHERVNMYTVREGRYIHIVAVRNEDDQVKLICFDMTDIYEKIGKRRSKEDKINVKELMEMHKPRKKENNKD